MTTPVADTISKEKIQSSITELIVLLRQFRQQNGLPTNGKRRSKSKDAAVVMPIIDSIKTFLNNKYGNTKPGDAINFAQIKEDLKAANISTFFEEIGMAVADSPDWCLDNGRNVWNAIRMDDSNREYLMKKHGPLERSFRNKIHAIKQEPIEKDPERTQPQPKQQQPPPAQAPQPPQQDMTVDNTQAPILDSVPQIDEPPDVIATPPPAFTPNPIEPTFNADETI